MYEAIIKIAEFGGLLLALIVLAVSSYIIGVFGIRYVFKSKEDLIEEMRGG